MRCSLKYKNNNNIAIVSIIFIIALICLSHYYLNYYRQWSLIENFESREENIKAFYINLEKNSKRKNDFVTSYYNSDLNVIPLTRFPAILGRNVDVNLWLKADAIQELLITELTGERTHHYQLTYGGVGCFLSHYTLAKQLLEDNSAKYYLIFEDDISFVKNTINPINYYLSNAPDDWDILYFANTRRINYTTHGQFYKPTGFWGTQSYIINKKGAKKLIEEVQREKIDGQIDAYLSRMIQQHKINIYITDRNLTYNTDHSNSSDIQYRLQRSLSNINPFNYKGYLV
jgi:GR25 family glycosyltransferase involved in LPS biosynthesis